MIDIFNTPSEVAKQIGRLAREKRLAKNLSQETLSKHSQVSLGTLKKFEQTGKISLESLLKIALALDALDDFLKVFQLQETYPSLDQILEEKSRKRGRK